VIECVNYFSIGNVRQVGANNMTEQKGLLGKILSDISETGEHLPWGSSGNGIV